MENIPSSEQLNSKVQNELVENDHSHLICGKKHTNNFSPNRSNLVSNSVLHNVLDDGHALDKTNSNQCLKNGLKNYQCSADCDIVKSDSENKMNNTNLNKVDTSTKVYDRLFVNEKKACHKCSDNTSHDVSSRKSPIHGKAPRNSAFHETKEFHKLDSMEGSAGETLQSNVSLKYKQSEITSIETSNISDFNKVNSLDGSCNSSYPSDIKDCARIVTDSDNNFFSGGKLNEETKEKTMNKLSETSDNMVQNKECSKDFVTKKSEDTRSLTIKRCNDALPRSRKSHNKKQIDRSSRTKLKKTKPGQSLSERCSVRLTRSQKKDPQQVAVPIGAADDDSGIQGDIYEFSEKESNLEDITLPNRVPHVRDRYNDVKENPIASSMSLNSWNGCGNNEGDSDYSKEKQPKAYRINGESKPDWYVCKKSICEFRYS